jgi:hypothetical protein
MAAEQPKHGGGSRCGASVRVIVVCAHVAPPDLSPNVCPPAGSVSSCVSARNVPPAARPPKTHIVSSSSATAAWP